MKLREFTKEDSYGYMGVEGPALITYDAKVEDVDVTVIVDSTGVDINAVDDQGRLRVWLRFDTTFAAAKLITEGLPEQMNAADLLEMGFVDNAF